MHCIWRYARKPIMSTARPPKLPPTAAPMTLPVFEEPPGRTGPEPFIVPLPIVVAPPFILPPLMVVPPPFVPPRIVVPPPFVKPGFKGGVVLGDVVTTAGAIRSDTSVPVVPVRRRDDEFIKEITLT